MIPLITAHGVFLVYRKESNPPPNTESPDSSVSSVANTATGVRDSTWTNNGLGDHSNITRSGGGTVGTGPVSSFDVKSSTSGPMESSPSTGTSTGDSADKECGDSADMDITPPIGERQGGSGTTASGDMTGSGPVVSVVTGPTSSAGTDQSVSTGRVQRHSFFSIFGPITTTEERTLHRLSGRPTGFVFYTGHTPGRNQRGVSCDLTSSDFDCLVQSNRRLNDKIINVVFELVAQQRAITDGVPYHFVDTFF
jgi:hypothetical protein